MPGLVPGIHVGHDPTVQGGWVYIVTNHGLKRVVHYERFDDIRDAIQREKTMKHWSRAWKVGRILDQNPDWADLYDTLA